MRQDGMIGGQVEVQPPALLLTFGGVVPRPRDDLCGQTGQPRFFPRMKMPGVGRILHVLVELGLGRREFLHQALEPGFVLVGQRYASQPEIPQLLFDEHMHVGRRIFGHRVSDALVGFLELLVL